MLCILSDTHENTAAIEKAVAVMRDLKPQLVVHCGDIISPPVLKYFAGLPLRLVFGNNDGEREGLKNKVAELGFIGIDDEAEFEVDGKRFYVYHGTSSRKLNERVDSQSYDYVLTGHTHERRDERRGRTRIINPGALFMARVYSIAVLEPTTDILEFREISKS